MIKARGVSRGIFRARDLHRKVVAPSARINAPVGLGRVGSGLTPSPSMDTYYALVLCGRRQKGTLLAPRRRGGQEVAPKRIEVLTPRLWWCLCGTKTDQLVSSGDSGSWLLVADLICAVFAVLLHDSVASATTREMEMYHVWFPE